MSEILAMGGYAQYVWTAFGVSFFALLALYWMTQRTFRQAQQQTRRFVQSIQDDHS
jgi:heme exporter protein CcmD